MIKSFLHRAVISVLAIGAATIPATAQFRWPPDDAPPTTQTQPVPSKPKDKKVPATLGPLVAGSWRGELTQVGSRAPYKIEVIISAGGGETKYSDLNCSGKLIRVGASKSYAFFIEIITKGAADKGGRCPDGTITLARAGENNLALLWFGNIDANSIIAYGTLSKK